MGGERLETCAAETPQGHHPAAHDGPQPGRTGRTDTGGQRAQPSRRPQQARARPRPDHLLGQAELVHEGSGTGGAEVQCLGPDIDGAPREVDGAHLPAESVRALDERRGAAAQGESTGGDETGDPASDDDDGGSAVQLVHAALLD
jgi:hypothetical protein